MSAILSATSLGRWYGQVVGLNDLSVEIGGGVTGLVGPNGAGKSTLLKLITGEMRPSRGTIRVFGEDPFANRALYRRLGFCPQQDALYGRMSGLDMVSFLLRLGGYSRSDADRRARAALERVDMEGAMRRRVSTYSKGMRQRVKLAQAIAHDPELIVLDEPLTGLDPLGRRAVLALLRELGENGMHVLISSHVLHELETLTQEILLVHRGRLVAQGTVGEVRRLLSQQPRQIELRARRARELARALVGFEEVVAVRLADTGSAITLETREVERFFAKLTELAAAERFGLVGIESLDAGLDAVYEYVVQ